ncbi:MAG: hypothetical protein PSN34_15595 [Urechidicola sp.]|nr:hypothetical protein [Urechidicola sp.]
MKSIKHYLKVLQNFLRIPFSISNGIKQRIRKKMHIILNEAASTF